MQKVTLAYLRRRTRALADEQSSSGGASSLVDPDELLDHINEAISSYYALITEVQGHEFFVRQHVWDLVADQGDYALPLDFGIGALQLHLEYSRWRFEIYPWQQQDSAWLHNLNEYGGPWGYQYLVWCNQYLRYRFQGDVMEILPVPRPGDDGRYKIHMRYVPTSPQLTNEEDTIDSVNGWHKYVCWKAVIPMLIKSETDTTEAYRQLADIEREIRSHAPKRDRGRPAVVQDTLQDDWQAPGSYGVGVVVRD